MIDSPAETYLLECDHLLDAARRQSGLTDFGDEGFVEPMQVLLESLNTEANLNTIGRSVQYQRILNTLMNRLRIQAWLQQYPEIREEVIADPVLIVGLQRTGTTLLHRTLASDPAFFAPLWYEVRNPAPYMDWQFDPAQDQRIVEATAEVDAMLAANPELKAIHPMDPVGADEEILLLEHSFYSTVPESFYHLPTYGAWLESHDNRPGYDFLKLCLQFLQWQKERSGRSATRWLLKTPHHLHYISTLLDVFPDAKIIATHRDPVVTIPSAASFNYNLSVIGSDAADPVRVGEVWARKFCNGLEHTMATRELCGDAFYDVWFRDTVDKPLETIAGIYDWLGMELTPHVRSAMESYREANRREDRPQHTYTLDQFGFTEAELKAQFSAYRAAYIDARG